MPLARAGSLLDNPSEDRFDQDMISESERRSYPRADAVFEMNYTEGTGSPAIATMSRDFSTGGISFRTASGYAPQTDLSLGFSMSGLPAPIEARGTVVRSWEADGDFFTAVQFTHINGTDMNVILDYIRDKT